MTYQHLAFAMTFRNVDTGAEIELSFGGVHYVAADWDDDAKECAIFHCADKVCGNADIVAEFGNIRPLPRTFKLHGLHTPSDQALG